MSNEGTKKQIQDWMDIAYEESKKTDPREKYKKLRKEKIKKVASRYGLS